MRDDVVLLGKPIDNSRVVRQADPRSRREIVMICLRVALLAAALGFYAWPALEIRRAEQQNVILYREKERLLEEGRKLQLERAALENLRRVEAIAARDLGLTSPDPHQSLVVEVSTPLPPGSSVAREERPPQQARAETRREALP